MLEEGSAGDIATWRQAVNDDVKAVAETAQGHPFVPPGQDDNFVPPGHDDNFTPPGQNRNGPKAKEADN